jgi:predicted O-linked N-acetylglucosamine transferase (SPINDLY family)
MSNSNFQSAVNQAMQLQRAGQLPEAEKVYRSILRTHPNWGDGYAQLAGVLFAMNQLEPAATALQKAIDRRPSNPAFCHNNLGVIFDRLKRYEDAAKSYRKAIAALPQYVIAHRNLGDALRQSGHLDAAEASYRTALSLDPKLVDGYIGIGLILFDRKRFAEAVKLFEIALQLDPLNTNACMNCAFCYGRLGDRDATETTLRRSIKLMPHEAELHSGLVMTLNYVHGAELPYMLNESLAFDRQHIVPLAVKIKPLSNDRDPNRRLRIGYLSPDFRHHSVAYFLKPVMENHDHESFFIASYAEVAKPDEWTAAFEKHSDLWRNTVGLSHDELADQIRADGIDILIDLAGHTVDNRLPVMGRRPAPVQVTWLGYPNTTGVSTIDYRLTDRFADPDGADAAYSEKLVRLPDAFFVYHPPAAAPPVSPLPMKTNGQITFGSFNNIAKITQSVGKLWADLLRALPEAKLIIAGVSSTASERLRDMSTGSADQRIEIVESKNLEEYLKLHDRVDIALDPFPWAGHTTTCHALWMGVPTITLAGPTALSRAGVSLMANLGMENKWVASTPEQYIQLAIDWSKRPEDLAIVRASLRDRMQLSPLMDAKRFTKNLEAQLRQLWNSNPPRR